MDFDPHLVIDEDPEVYRPSDDSYLLLAAVSVLPGERLLEVGTGTGLIAIHAARLTPAIATDMNGRAVRLARENARRFGVELGLVRCDLMSALRGPFDVVAFNPPYIEGQPKDELDRAWHGGDRGAEVAIRFLRDLPRVLSQRGRAYLVLTDTNEEAWLEAMSNFTAKVVLSKAMFFEHLSVLELRPKPVG
jgi:release factor glutamine methyltransferase